MAATFAAKKRQSLGSVRGVTGTVNLGTYATNGISVTPHMIGLKTIISFQADPTAGYVFQYDHTAQKLKAYQVGTITPTGTVAAPTFTATAHTHSITLGATTTGGTAVFFNTGQFHEGAGGTVTQGVESVVVTGTNSAPAFTGSASTAGPLSEVGVVDLSTTPGAIRFVAIGK